MCACVCVCMRVWLCVCVCVQVRARAVCRCRRDIACKMMLCFRLAPVDLIKPGRFLCFSLSPFLQPSHPPSLLSPSLWRGVPHSFDHSPSPSRPCSLTQSHPPTFSLLPTAFSSPRPQPRRYLAAAVNSSEGVGELWSYSLEGRRYVSRISRKCRVCQSARERESGERERTRARALCAQVPGLGCTA